MVVSVDPTRPLVGLVAGEASGDRLGASFMVAFQQRQPEVQFVGIGGPAMVAAGLQSLAPMSELGMNGFREPIVRLPTLIRILRQLLQFFREHPPNVFLGIDFNVFNLLLEGRLKKRGIATAHYVSPSVYAWRRGRVNRIGRSTDLLLTLYPFEPPFYTDTSVRAVYVGHPMADEIGLETGSQTAREAARQALGLQVDKPCLALLPGSRASEINLLGPTFFAAASLFREINRDFQFVVPCVNERAQRLVDEQLAQWPNLPVSAYLGDARAALTVCNLALVKSGTSTLEAMLLHRPMVVSYRLGWVTYQIVKRMLRSPHVALPNILAGRMLVPELLQDEGSAEVLCAALNKLFHDLPQQRACLKEFKSLHLTLRRGADHQAAVAVEELMQANQQTN